MNTLILFRVPYGKDSTPMEDREYHLANGSPVGNVAELQPFYIGKYDKIVLMDKDNKEVEQEINLC